MKLTSQVSRTYKDKGYKKTIFVIPSKFLKKLKWEGNEEVDAKVKGNKIIIEKK